MDRFTHNLYDFSLWEQRQCWEIEAAWNMSDMYREMGKLVEEGIPQEAMNVIAHEYDKRCGRKYYRLTIDLSADEQVQALAQRLRQAWLAQKAIEDAQYQVQQKAAIRNQQAQDEFEWAF